MKNALARELLGNLLLQRLQRTCRTDSFTLGGSAVHDTSYKYTRSFARAVLCCSRGSKHIIHKILESDWFGDCLVSGCEDLEVNNRNWPWRCIYVCVMSPFLAEKVEPGWTFLQPDAGLSHCITPMLSLHFPHSTTRRAVSLHTKPRSVWAPAHAHIKKSSIKNANTMITKRLKCSHLTSTMSLSTCVSCPFLSLAYCSNRVASAVMM